MGNGNRRAGLAEILRRARNSNPLDMGTNLPGLEPDGFDDFDGRLSSSRADFWGDDVRELLNLVPEDLFAVWQAHDDDLSYSVTKVYENKEIHGVVSDRRRDGKVFFSFEKFESGQCEFGCTHCDAPKSNLCHHILGLIDFVDDQLDGRRSKLRSQIDRGRFASGKPNRSAFAVDTSKRVLTEIKNLLTYLPSSEVDGAFDDVLPPVDEVAEQRIGWAFQYGSAGLSIAPMLQQRKKRGNGFTKGRKISLEKLMTDRSLPLSKTDEQVVAEIYTEPDYYSRRTVSYGLSPLAAMKHLVGQENVTLRDEPCTVERGTPLLQIEPVQGDKDLLRFQLARPWKDAGEVSVLYSHTEMAAVDPEKERLCFLDASEAAIMAIRSLLNSTPFASNQAAAVLKQLDTIRPLVSIRLPESIGGPIVDESASPAVLLRSRSDGKLDYGIRVRTESGKLKRPAAPPLICTETRDKKPIQLVRNGAKEGAIATQLLSDLGLPERHEHWHGTIDDFQVALRVIERLQSGEIDVEVLWDKSSEKPIKVLGNLSSNNVRVDISSKRNWFGVTGECKFGNQSMPLAELLSSLPSGDQTIGDFISLGDGGWAKINDKLRERLKQLRDVTHSDRKTLKLDATAAPAVRDLMDDDVEVKATKAWEKCLKRLAKAEKLKPVVPKNLDANLRDYQVEGFAWLSRLAAWGVGGILADDMGLGKTLQTLAVLLDRAADGPALVIAPTSVGFNWQREAQRFAPDLDVHLYRETERADFLSSVGPGTLVVCSYGLALRDAEALAGVEWNTLVLDEAQAIKNSRSKTSRAIASIDADWTVALTGTPVENHLGELWSLFHVVSPGVFGGWEQFRSRYAGPIEKQNDDDARESLATRIQPFVLRRTKSQVLTELPPRTEMNLYVDLSVAERAEYEKVRLAAIGEIEQIESLPNIQDQRFKILALMTRLRQISCHAGLVNQDWTESSAKLDQLCETLESLREEGHRALVFSQFTSHLALIRTAMEERGFTYEYLDGSTPAAKRQEAVDRFQNETADAFLISLKAGGTGLNLTAADYVIHMDPWWNPAVEDQATDRAHRYGQDKPVMVYRIVARGTIEEEILALHDSKRDLVAGVMKGTQAAAKLTNEDLMRMMRG